MGRSRSSFLPSAPILALFPGASANEIAAACGVPERTVVRWRAGAGIQTAWRADRLAVALGHHPITLWGEAWETAA